MHHCGRDLISRIIVSEGKNPEFGVRCIFRWRSVAYHSGVIVTLSLTSGPVKILFLEYGHVAYQIKENVMFDNKQEKCQPYTYPRSLSVVKTVF